MNFLSAENISKSFGELVLFENLNLGVQKGEKIALIARNGAGKSSLLKILAAKEESDGGNIVINPDIKLGFLDQNPLFNESLSIEEYIKSASTFVLAIIKEYKQALEAQSTQSTKDTQNAFEEASLKMDLHKAWDYEQRLKQILSRFKISDTSQKISTLSGGQKKRLALAITLLDEPDLLLLDEPTNHLDIEMIEWLEKYLQYSNVTLLMVTHDRYFLDRVCNHIWEINNQKLYHHKGNYAYYLEKSAEREEVEKIETHKAQRLMKKELEWIRRSPMARTTKSKARIDAFEDLKEKASNVKHDNDIKLEVKTNRIGGKILEIEHLNKSFGDIKITDDFNYIFKKGERIGIVGSNGSGKSSFLNLITSRIKPDSGKISVGGTIVYGYYTQEGIVVDESKRVIEVLKDIAEVVEMGDGSKLSATQFLNYFLFTPEMQFNYVSNLSGGEKRRLHLLTVLIKNPNFLILDEPTNDLDLLTLNKLEEFLINYKGCLLLVSHDRYFMDKLADHIFIFEGQGKIKDFYGNYTDYRKTKDELEKQEKGIKSAQKKIEVKEKQSNKPTVKTKLSFKEKREYEQLEKEIEELETEKSTLEKEINSGETDYEKLQQMGNRIAELIDIIDERGMRWLELDEFC
jgi:ATP-binding cassette subfamily F protein uup